MYSSNHEMILSSYFKCGPLQALKTNALALDFPDNDSSDSFNLLNTFFGGSCNDSENFSYHELFSDRVLPCFPSVSDGFVSASSDVLPCQDFDVYTLLKRRKFPEDQCFMEIAPTVYDGFVQNVSYAPEFQVHEGDSIRSFENGKRDDHKYVSAQSNTARERRRKITEKTRELGSLVPGGTRMNTAEMLHAACKYVKFLQTQVGLFQLISSFQERVEATAVKELWILASETIQEKLYKDDKCLIPKDFIEILTNHQNILAEDLVYELKQLIEPE